MVAERFIEAFCAADFETMHECLAPDLVAWVTDSEGETLRVDGRDEYLARVEAMDLPSANLSMEITQAPVQVDTDKVLLLVEIHAERAGRSLHNFAGHLIRVEDGRIAEWWMTDAKPAESESFWVS